MGGRAKKKIDVSKNARLDLFLVKLESEQILRKQMLGFVEQLTIETIKDKSKPPALRLYKPHLT